MTMKTKPNAAATSSVKTQQSPKSSIQLLRSSASRQVDGMLACWRPCYICGAINLLQLHDYTVSVSNTNEWILLASKVQHRRYKRYRFSLWIYHLSVSVFGNSKSTAVISPSYRCAAVLLYWYSIYLVLACMHTDKLALLKTAKCSDI